MSKAIERKLKAFMEGVAADTATQVRKICDLKISEFIGSSTPKDDFQYVESGLKYLGEEDNMALWLARIAHDHPEWSPKWASRYESILSEFEALPMCIRKLDNNWNLFLATGDVKWANGVGKECNNDDPLLACAASWSYNSMCEQFPCIKKIETME